MKYALSILLLFTFISGQAQVNLVKNPSFEQYSLCPDNWDEIKYAYHWMSLDTSWSPPDWAHDPPGVPDYCNICATSAVTRVPNNGQFYQYPHTGNGVVQVQMFFNEWTSINLKRDYLQGHLYETLTPGQSYCVSFYVIQEESSGYGINHIGAYLDDGTIDTTNNPGLIQTQYIPQVLESTVITDTFHWTKIEGNFVANGTERLITIGNFSDTAHMTYVLMPGLITPTGPVFSWYLVDDISVIRSDAMANAGPDHVIAVGDTVVIGDTLDSYIPSNWYVNGIKIDSNTATIKVHPDTTTRYVMSLQLCGGDVSYDTVVVWVSTTGNIPLTPKGEPAIWPNPVKDELHVDIGTYNFYTITNSIGQLLMHDQLNATQTNVNVRSLPAGLYYITLRGDNGVAVQKFVKM